MATTALQLNQRLFPTESYHRRVQELTDVATRYTPRFRQIAFGHLGNAADAEDAVQDALLSAFAHVDQFRGQAKMSTWLTAIVINSARMKLRQRSAPVHMFLDESNEHHGFRLAEMVSDTRPGPEEIYRTHEIAETVAHATARLSPVLRTTFKLRDVNGLSIRETAHRMGVPSGTVKARLARARARLKEATKRNTWAGRKQPPVLSRTELERR